MTWWKSKPPAVPTLAKVTKHYIGCLATSASERLFNIWKCIWFHYKRMSQKRKCSNHIFKPQPETLTSKKGSQCKHRDRHVQWQFKVVAALHAVTAKQVRHYVQDLFDKPMSSKDQLLRIYLHMCTHSVLPFSCEMIKYDTANDEQQVLFDSSELLPVSQWELGFLSLNLSPVYLNYVFLFKIPHPCCQKPGCWPELHCIGPPTKQSCGEMGCPDHGPSHQAMGAALILDLSRSQGHWSGLPVHWRRCCHSWRWWIRSWNQKCVLQLGHWLCP